MKSRITVLSFLLILLSIPAIAQIEGMWKGILKVPSAELEMIFDIKKDNNALKASLSIPSQNVSDLRIDIVDYNASTHTLHLELSQIGIKYIGKLDNETVEGAYHQSGIELPMNLYKMSEKEIEISTAPKYNRPQTPKAPFPYEMKEVEFLNKEDNINITGVISQPENASIKKQNLIILFNGSGQQNRDANIYEHKLFLVIADHLTRLGYSVLRYDDRGTGGTSIGKDINSATTLDFTRDGQAAIDFAKSLGYKKIHLIGHSEGGIIAGMLAVQNPDIKSVIQLAGQSVNGGIILTEQIYRGQVLAGLAISKADYLKDVLRYLTETVYSTPGITSSELMNKGNQYAQNHVSHTENYDETMRQSIEAFAELFTAAWMQQFIRTEPSTYIGKIKCPVLAIYGGTDIQVPYDVNYPVMKELLKSNKKSEVIVIENINHFLQHSTTGSGQEYELIEETINIKVLKEITDWLSRHK